MMYLGACFIIVTALAGVSQSLQPPSPTPPNAEQKNQADPQGKQQPTNPDQRGTDTSPLFIKVIPPLAVEPPTAEHAQQSNWYTSPEWWLVWVTIILAAITAILAGYTAKLWGATNSLVDDAKKTATQQAEDIQTSLDIAKQSADATAKMATTMEHTAARQAREMKESLWIAQESADAAEAMADTMKDTARRQLRAYVAVANATFINDTSSGIADVSVCIKMQNFGETPATAISYWVGVTSGKFPLEIALPKDPPSGIRRAGVIAPNHNLKAIVKLPLLDVPSFTHALYVFGECHYTDAFGKPRVSPFRYMRRGSENWAYEGKLEMCDEGNDPN